MSATAANLAAALVAAQADMPRVDKDSTNPHFRSKFVSLDHLIALTRPVLNKHGLAISQNPTHIDGQPALETKLTHGPSNESASSVMPLLLGKNDMQGLGGAITYGRRYAWASLLGIASEEDDDGNSASEPREATGATQTASAPASGFRAPTGDLRSDKQASALYAIFKNLEKAGAITEPQIIAAGEAIGVEGAQGIQSLAERVTKSQASNLIERLKTLEANLKAQAAA